VEPISFVDQLVKGVILAVYDFVRLTWAGFVIPLATKRRQFWTYIVSVESRLSSLTYLVLWVLLTVSIGSRSSADIASSVTGLAKTPGRDIPSTIVLALLVSILVDVSIRLSLSTLRSRVRRQLYGDLARVAAANIFFGACVIMVLFSTIWGPSFFAPILGPIVYLVFPVAPPLPGLPNPLIFLFCISLAIIMVKALAIRGRARRILTGALVVFLTPMLLSGIAFPSWRLVQQFLDTISPTVEESIDILSNYSSCEFSSEKIRLSSDLMLKGAANAVLLKAHRLAIYETDDARGHGAVYIGRPNDEQSAIILLRDKFIHIEVTADFSPLSVCPKTN
jgi:hypothetical protein